MTDHDEGGDPACWAHLFDDTGGDGVDDGVDDGVNDPAETLLGPAPARSAGAGQPDADETSAAQSEGP